MSYDIEQVRLIATEVRSFLEPRWIQALQDNGLAIPDGIPVSYRMCRFSTCFLKKVLEKEIPDVGWQWVGGSPCEDEDIDIDMTFPGGYLANSGQWFGHYWVTDEEFDLIVDVTADQFGSDPVTVKPFPLTSLDYVDSKSVRFEYRENYRSDAVDSHMEGVSDRVHRWLAEWEREHTIGWSSAQSRPALA